MSQVKILVVGHEPYYLNIVGLCLREADFEVSTSFDGENAIQKSKQEKPNLILLAEGPPKPGWEEICRLLKRDPDTRNIPVVLLALSSSRLYRSLSYEVGAADYIVWPFRTSYLLERIRKILDIHLPDQQVDKF